MMAAILNSAILDSATGILGSAILVIFSQNSLILAKIWFQLIGSKNKLHSHFPPHHLHKKTSLIHSYST